ncbi:Choline transport protein [Teratosphaeria destructans]|uniref:Choline transport protein n=1 Tax=Teratosphaeria destructans TaxID=418781 RepID=A0A9W7SWJ3_9PEZI|nr:Choline transport protein [Teratosphaeria destructans]
MEDEKKPLPDLNGSDDIPEHGELINCSGHVQELDRGFGFWSICSLGILSDNAWGAGGGALVVSLYNGGGPGVMYGLIVSILFYSLIAACLAEMASALPSSANVYHWASVTSGPRWGKLVSFYAGSWIFGVASSSLFAAETVIGMYSVYHPDYEPQRWQYFIVYVIITWLDLSLVLFGQRFLAKAATGMGISLMLIWLVTTLVVAIMPSRTGEGYATDAFVWKDFQNFTGWSSSGFVFVMGILNGAYAIGTPDGVTHLCEEIPRPRKNIPYGILSQMTAGSVTTFLFYIAILYAVTDLTAVFDSDITGLPLAAMYQQAMRSNGGTFGLLFLFLIDQILNIPGGYITCGRMLWGLARDDAVPFSAWVRHISPAWRNPFNAQIVCGVIVTILGAIYVGNATAFTAFIGSFTIFTTWSYCAAILPHLLTRRKYLEKSKGPFWMPAWLAYPVMSIASAYILVFNVIYMFPYTYPATVENMNYACVMTVGITILLTMWYFWKRSRGYEGPIVVLEGHDDILEGVVGLSEEEEERLRRLAVGEQ